jgi:hypothetical protein
MPDERHEEGMMVVRVVDVAPGVGEVPMIEPAVVRQLRVLAEQGWGSKRIAAELGIARNTVRSYLRGVGSRHRCAQPADGSTSGADRKLCGCSKVLPKAMPW